MRRFAAAIPAQPDAESLTVIYQRAADPAESYAALRSAVDAVFGPLTVFESRAIAETFGIRLRLRSKRQAVDAVWRWIEQRLESAQRCQF